MSAFFLGPAERRLFGYHHAPSGTPTGAVLLCASWGREYENAHRALHFLAKRLASAGRHVLRFDYAGSGDSWGEPSEADTEQWVRDAMLAADELETISGSDCVDLVGLRIGAFVATRVAQEAPCRRRVVLWDPITDGEGWIDDLGLVPPRGARRLPELGHQSVSEAFVDQVRSIGPGSFRIDQAERVLLFETQGQGLPREALSHLEGLEHVRLEQPAPWIEDESIWSGKLPVDAVGRIVEWLR